MKRRRVKRRRNKITVLPGVSDVVAKRNKLSVVTCSHPVKLNGGKLCGVCGATLASSAYAHLVAKKAMEAASSSDTSRRTQRTINVSGGHSIDVSNEEAKHIGYREVKSLFRSGQISLVLDLDATLIHATVQRNIQTKMEYEKKVRHEERLMTNSPSRSSTLDIPTNKNIEGDFCSLTEGTSLRESIISTFKMGQTVHFVKLRPNLYEFLDKAHKKFRLYIYTHGTREYAQNIAKLIDPSGKYFHGRILSRSDCPAGLKQKELRRLFPCGVSMVAVLDDREDVWLSSLNNLIKIEPYKFWKDAAEINNKTGSSILSPQMYGSKTISSGMGEADKHLSWCYRILEEAHAKFYSSIDYGMSMEERVKSQMDGCGPSVPNILTTIRETVLNQCNIIFTGVIPQEVNLAKHPYVRLVYRFGGQVSRQVQEGVTHVVCAKPGTNKSIRGARQGCYVVRLDWLLDSVTRWQRQDESEYQFREMLLYTSQCKTPGSSAFKSTGLQLKWNLKFPVQKSTGLNVDENLDALLDREVNIELKREKISDFEVSLKAEELKPISVIGNIAAVDPEDYRNDQDEDAEIDEEEFLS